MNTIDNGKNPGSTLTLKIVFALIAGLGTGIFMKAIPNSSFVDQFLLDGLFFIMVVIGIPVVGFVVCVGVISELVEKNFVR